MQRHEHGAAERISQRSALVKRRIFRLLPRQDYAQALALEFRAHREAQLQYGVAFGRSVRTARACVRPAVRGIEDHGSRSGGQR